MAVRIRMKKLGRKHRPFFRICAVDKRAPRDGRVIEELGYYDPMVKEKHARAVLKADRVDYWLRVGAQPSQKCAVLIRKYGTGGTHLEIQQTAFERLAVKPQAPEPIAIPMPAEAEAVPVEEVPAKEAAPAEEAAAVEAPAEGEAAAEEAKVEQAEVETEAAKKKGGEEATEKSE